MTMAMPAVQFAELGAIRMAYHDAGEGGGRPPLLLCHGFPETAFSWRHQIPAFAAAGWRVIAMDQRGYGRTTAPAEVAAYCADALCDDYEALLDHIGAAQAIFVGHDWGAAMAWQMAMRRPDRVAGVVSLNTPFQRRAPIDPIAIMRARMGPDMYIVAFQEPREPEAILADARRTLAYFFRRPAADARPSRGYDERRAPGAPSIFPLLREIAEYEARADRRARFLGSAEFEEFVRAFEQGGFAGGINWYRNITRNWESAAAYDHVIRQPSLMLMAEKDPWLPPASADGMEAIVPDLEKRLIEDCGHWSQQEKPAEVNRAVLDWLHRRFAAPAAGAPRLAIA